MAHEDDRIEALEPEASSPPEPVSGGRSRRETAQRILDAALELFSERNPDTVSVREIAERAGVTHALIHQYFGSKDDLMHWVFERNSWDFREMARHSADIKPAVRAMFTETLERRAYSRAFIRSAMDGIGLIELGATGGTLTQLLTLEEASIAGGRDPEPACRGVDPRVVIAAMTSLAMGWNAMGDYVCTVLEIPEEERTEFEMHISDVMACIADFAFPADAEGNAS